MALNHYYTLSKIRSLLRELVNELGVNNIQDTTILEIINANTFDIAEQLNGSLAPDYGSTSELSDAATHHSETNVLMTSYTDATKTIVKAGHGFTTADIGRRIILHSEIPGSAGISRIAGITSTSAFTIEHALGATIAAGASHYYVLSRQSTTSLSLSALKVDKIIKLVDATNGLVAERKDLAFENLAGIDQYDNSVFYNHIGETLYLFKGANVTSWGTLTLHYYRLPNAVTADTDYIDLKEKYIKLLLGACKLDIYELAQKQAPKELTQSVESKTAAIRQTNLEKEAVLSGRKA